MLNNELMKNVKHWKTSGNFFVPGLLGKARRKEMGQMLKLMYFWLENDKNRLRNCFIQD